MRFLVLFFLMAFGGASVVGQTPGGVSNIQPGRIQYDYFEFSTPLVVCSQLDGLNPVASGTATAINHNANPGRRVDNYGYIFRAYLYVPTAGTWRFFTGSDDGSMLYINNALVVNNDSIHPFKEEFGDAMLTAGWHQIKVYFFENAVADSLVVHWQDVTNAGPKQQIPFPGVAGTAGIHLPTMPMWVEGAHAQVVGARVQTWLDRGGLHNLTQATAANRPQYANGAGDAAFNFNPYIRFNQGSTSEFLGNSNYNGFGLDAAAHFIVARRGSTSNYEALFSYNIVGNDNQWLLDNPDNLAIYLREPGFGQFMSLNMTAQNMPYLIRVQHRNAGGSNLNYGLNGTTADVQYKRNEKVNNGGFFLLAQEQDLPGGGFEASQCFRGDIAEMINFNRAITAAERDRIETYLGIKYGMTLAHDYIASDGTMLWDISAAGYSTHSNQIAGVAKDYVGFLSQNRSRSVVPSAVLTIQNEVPFPATNVNAPLSAWICGRNATTNLFTAFTAIQAPPAMQISRAVWRAKATNFTNTLTLEFNATGFDLSSDYYLVINSTNNFASGSRVVPGAISSGLLSFTGVNIADGEYFTIGKIDNPPVVNFFNNEPGAPATWEACPGASVTFAYQNFSQHPNRVVLRDLGGNSLVIPVTAVPTSTGILNAGSFTFNIPANAATGIVTFRNNTTDIFTTTAFLIIHNPTLDLALEKDPICATDSMVRLTGFPSGGIFEAGTSNFTPQTNLVSFSSGNYWFNPTNIAMNPALNEGTRTVFVRYTFQPRYIGNNNACGAPRNVVRSAVVRDNRLTNVPFAPIITASYTLAPNLEARLDTLLDRPAIRPELPVGQVFTYSGTYVYSSPFATGLLLYGQAGFGNHPIVVSFNNGGCSNTITSSIEVSPPVAIPGLLPILCREALPLNFFRDSDYRDTTVIENVRDFAGNLVYQTVTRRNQMNGVPFCANAAHNGALSTQSTTTNLERYRFNPALIPVGDTLVTVFMPFRTTITTTYYDPSNGTVTGTNTRTLTFFARHQMVLRPRPVVTIDSTLQLNYCMNAAPIVLRSNPAYDTRQTTRYWVRDQFDLSVDSLQPDTILNFFTLYNRQDSTQSRDVTFDLIYMIDRYGCQDFDTVQFRVIAPDRPSFIGRHPATKTYCLNSSEDLLIMNPALNTRPGTSIVGPGIGVFNNGSPAPFRNMFAPQATGQGMKVITYNYENAFGCRSQFRDTFFVRPQAVADLVTADNRTEYCANVNSAVLRVNVLSGAGVSSIVYSGVGVTDSIFNPSQVFGGNSGTTRVFSEFVDTFGCRALDTLSLIIREVPTLAIQGLDSVFCRNDTTERIFFSPRPNTGQGGFITSRGAFTRDTSTFFNPANVLTNFDTVRYQYTNQFGCVNTISQRVRIDSVPQVRINGLQPFYCVNSPTTLLGGIPDSTSLGIGRFGGPGINPNTGSFNPSLAGTGTKIVTYTFTDSRGCSNTRFDTTLIRALPVPTFTGLNPEYCIDAPMDTIRGTTAVTGTGYFVGRAVMDSVQGLILPANDTIGLRTIVYVFTDSFGCRNSSSQNFYIHPKPNISINGLEPAYCKNSPSQNIIGSPVGGTLVNNRANGLNPIAPGVASFSPITADTGQHILTYTFVSINGCRADTTARTRVYPAFTPTVTGLPSTYCEVRDTIPLVGTPSNGQYRGAGMIVNSNLFLPTLAGGGNHVIEYIVNDTFSTGTGTLVCSNRATQNITINPLPIPRILSPLDNSQYCSNDSLPRPLVGSVAAGTISFSSFRGSGLLLDVDTVFNFQTMTFRFDTTYLFSPALAGQGTHRVTFMVYNQFGCVDSIFNTYTVNAMPTATFTPLNAAYCENDANVQLTGSPVGGIFIRNGNTLAVSVFDPNDPPLTTASRTDTIVYRFIGGICVDYDTQYVQINRNPVVSFQGENLNNRYCLFPDSISLTPSINGGTFSGNGILFGSALFAPHIAGIGMHPISYTYADQTTGCSATYRDTLRVYSQPLVEFTNVGSCQDQAIILRPDNDLLGLDGFYQSAPFDSITMVSWNLGLGTTDTLVGSLTNNTLRDLPFQYASPGAYTVRLTVTNQNACTDSFSLRIVVSPKITSFPYLENFDASSGLWIPEDRGQQTSTIWEWGTPTNPNGIDVTSPVSSNNSPVWTTTLAQGYPRNVSAWVYSPCFDLTTLNRPMIALDYWSHTENNMDGAVLEYRDANGQWQPLGLVNRGINWFNTPIIVGSPGDQTLAPRGWSGRMSNFANARYKLDEVRYGPDSNVYRNFQIRVAFGSSSVTPLSPSDGFAFDNVWIGNRSRNVLLEHFSNVGKDNMDNINRHVYQLCFGTPLIRDVVMVQYQLNAPVTDEYHTPNSDNHNARALNYGVQQAGYSVIDGNDNDTLQSIRLNAERFEVDMLKTPLFDVQIDTFRILGNNTVQASATVQAKADLPISSYTVHMAILEDSLIYRQTLVPFQINSVVRQLLPNSSGNTLTQAWANGQQLSLTENWSFDPLTYQARNFSLVVFVQDEQTKEVYQVASSRDIERFLRFITGTDQPTPEALEEWTELHQAKLYPNPAIDHSRLDFGQNLQRDYQWMVVDLTGRVLQQGQLPSGSPALELNTSNLPSGMYLVVVRGEGVEIQRKLVVAKP